MRLLDRESSERKKVEVFNQIEMKQNRHFRIKVPSHGLGVGTSE